MSEGEFKKRAEQLIKREANESTKDSPDPFYYGHRDGIKKMLQIIDEAKKELPSKKTLEELKQYIQKNAVKLRDGTPIFSARRFIKIIEELEQALEKWFGEQGRVMKAVRIFAIAGMLEDALFIPTDGPQEWCILSITVLDKLLKERDVVLQKIVNAEEGAIKSCEDLKNYVFTCPFCGQVKAATELVVLVSPLNIEQKETADSVVMTVCETLQVCCLDCESKQEWKVI